MNDSSNQFLQLFLVLIVLAVISVINVIVIGIIANLLGSPIHYWEFVDEKVWPFLVLSLIEIYLYNRYKDKILNSIRNYLLKD
jgi:uncharacterized membrane protein